MPKSYERIGQGEYGGGKNSTGSDISQMPKSYNETGFLLQSGANPNNSG
jgi:hypothetical protein